MESFGEMRVPTHNSVSVGAVGAADGDARHKNSSPTAFTADLQITLERHPAVAQAVVRERTDVSGANVYVAYVQTLARCDERSLRDHVIHTLPETGRLLKHVVLISSIPYQKDGELDVEALNQFEVLDDAIAEQWERQISENDPKFASGSFAAVVADREMLREHIRVNKPIPRSSRREPAQTLRSDIVLPPAINQGPPLVLPLDTPNTLADLLLRAAEQFRESRVVHIGVGGEALTQSYSELLSTARRVLTGLRRLSLRQGQLVLLQLERTDRFMTGFWACILGGFVPVPISIPSVYQPENLVVQRLRSAWEMFDRPLILASDGSAKSWTDLGLELSMSDIRVANLADMVELPEEMSIANPAADDLALLLLTSGSTGLPKAVQHTHRTLIARSAAACLVEEQTNKDKSVNWMPLDHVGGIVMWHLRDVFAGSTQIHAQTNWILERPLRWLDLMDQYGATNTWAPNFAFALINEQTDVIAQAQWDLSKLRFVLNGGEMVVASTAQRFLKTLARHGLRADAMKPAWGMSETASGVTYNLEFSQDSADIHVNSLHVGKLIPGFQMRIVDSQDRLLHESQSGRLQVRGHQLTTGYYRNPERNREAFTSDGWFRTGDLARIDDGNLTITGREKDEIIINGVNIPALEIEAEVEKCLGVQPSCTAACSFRRPNADTDEIAIFFGTTADSGHPPAETVSNIRKRLRDALNIAPSEIVLLTAEDIPRTSIGKIRRADLLARLNAGDFDDRRFTLDAGKDRESLLNWFYRPIWRAKSWQENASPRVPGNAIVVEVADSPESVQIVTALQTIGWRVKTASVKSLSTMLHNGMPDLLIVPIVGDAEEASWHLLAILQTLDLFAGKTDQDVNTVSWSTANINGVNDGTYGSPAVASVSAILKTATRELPWLRPRLLLTDSLFQSAESLEAIIGDVTGQRLTDLEVAYQGGKRFVRRLEAVEIGGPDTLADSLLTNGGRYLITGGLGGIGEQVARYLLSEWNAKLLLVGRSPISEPLKQHVFQSLEKLGSVLYQVAAVENFEELGRAVEFAENHWNQEIDGVFHLSGEFHTQSIISETREGLQDAFGGKVHGALVLQKLLAKRAHPGFLVGFGSVNGYFGGAGVVAYAAANASLSALLHNHNDDQIVTRCIDWSMWAELGMSRGYAEKNVSLAAGFDVIEPPQGLISLEVALRQPHRHLLVGLNPLAAPMRSHLAGKPYALRQLTLCSENGTTPDHDSFPIPRDRFGTAITWTDRVIALMCRNSDGSINRRELIAEIHHTSGRREQSNETEPSGSIEKRIAAVFSEVLRLNQVGRNDPFLEIGGNSLSATQVISRLRSMFDVGAALTVRDLFQHSTVATLSAHIENVGLLAFERDESATPPMDDQTTKVDIDISEMSDAEVASMLEDLSREQEGIVQ